MKTDSCDKKICVVKHARHDKKIMFTDRTWRLQQKMALLMKPSHVSMEVHIQGPISFVSDEPVVQDVAT